MHLLKYSPYHSTFYFLILGILGCYDLKITPQCIAGSAGLHQISHIEMFQCTVLGNETKSAETLVYFFIIRVCGFH